MIVLFSWCFFTTFETIYVYRGLEYSMRLMSSRIVSYVLTSWRFVFIVSTKPMLSVLNFISKLAGTSSDTHVLHSMSVSTIF